MKTPIQLSHDFLKEILTKDSIALDATMGNGYDTLFLAEKAKKVFAFDIQEKALQVTKERLETHKINNAQLILDSHENMDQYVNEIDVAMFNLGYLPTADKSIITQPSTTIIALKKTLKILKKGGRVSIMIYYGHDGGMIEKEEVEAYLKTVPQNDFSIMKYQPVNQVNFPPFLIMIEKK